MADITGHVALTFDDGPHPDSTLPLLDALRAAGARATFFIWGEHAARHPELLLAIRDGGHWIANHTQTHPHLTEISERLVFKEINHAQAIIRQITGLAPALFRPPYGDTNARIRNHAARLGLTEVLWTVDTRDWDGATADQIVATAATVAPGGVILMHDNGYQSTVAAVPRILEQLAARGLTPGPAGHPLVAPEVRPPTRWRSAIA